MPSFLSNTADLRPQDPQVPDWHQLVLPETWPDTLNFRHPATWVQLLSHALGIKRQRVHLPEGVPGRDIIPRYVLQEFHNLPNGNYSHHITRGYISSFNRVMLGHISRAHQRIADALSHGESALDAGCGGGGLAGALQAKGVHDVWGIDPSPYLLRHAANDWPGIRFVQGIAEHTHFADARFDGIGACFLLHEIPGKHLHASLREFHRILKTDGLLAICEPSPLQLQLPLSTMVKQWGWQGLYFYLFARKVFDPFVEFWHRQDIATLMQQHGFEVLHDDVGMPIRYILVRKAG